jgi:acyl-CoA synthetase (AMP-forming)/AMP-acid ligase II
MFVTWEAGAALCCPSEKELIKPGGWIRAQEITIWFSVPSTAIFMKRLGMLKPDAYPGLRHSMFAGEALPVEVAKAWIAAAPNSTLENLYGPTEATIVCVGYGWDPGRSDAEVEAGTVPIGFGLSDCEALVLDPQTLEPVPPGETGELVIAGRQVTLGYWRDEEKTAAAFVVPPGRSDRCYRTGDRVRRPAREDQPITYLGRLDNQIKVRGVRVELGEVEAVIREVTGVDAVVCLGWPVTPVGVDGIVAFIAEPDLPVPATKAALEGLLPVHMVPRRFELVADLPLNASGKFDRRALLASLEASA